MSTKYYLTKEIELFLKAEYPSKGHKFCADVLGVPKGTVQFWTGPRKLALPHLTKEARSKIMRETMGAGEGVDCELFTKKFTKESAYLLGLLWADGSINKNKVSLSCVIEDAADYSDIFMKTGNWKTFEMETHRYGVKTRRVKAFHTGNVILTEKLRNLGYAPNNKESPDFLLSLIPENIRHHWFRGLFDGDGCFQFNKKSGGCSMTITAPFDQDWNFIKKMAEHCNIICRITQDSYVNKHGKINSRSVFHITNADGCIKFFKYIYNFESDQFWGLKRKMDKWVKYVEFAKTRPKIKHLFENL